jgi:hypothetical protein
LPGTHQAPHVPRDEDRIAKPPEAGVVEREARAQRGAIAADVEMVQAEEPAKEPEQKSLDQHERVVQPARDTFGPAEHPAQAHAPGARLPARTGQAVQRQPGPNGAAQLGVAAQA